MPTVNPSIAANADYIIVGAGSAGCVIAARLSENPNVRVVLIEAGGRDRNPWLHIPVGFSKTIGNPQFDWSYQLGPEPGLNDRTIHYARGKALGGSSSINGLAWVTGGRPDYDRWGELAGEEWGYDAFLPYLKKIESFPPGGNHRGKDGPVSVQSNPGWTDAMDRLTEAFAAVGVDHVDDYNIENPLGVGRLQTNVSGGRRMSAATTYLAPARARSNLEVITDAEVESLVIVNGAATGVELRRFGRLQTLRANAEVILAAGAIGSPILLEKSGIGDPSRLAALGIAVTGAAQEVGENLKDHYLIPFRLQVKGLQSLNGSDRGLMAALTGLKYLFNRSGPMVETPTQLTGFMRVAPGEGPSDIQVLAMALTYSFMIVGDRIKAVMDTAPGMTLSFYPIYPKSTGSVHLQRDGSVKAVCNFLTDPDDQTLFVEAMREMRRVISQKPLADHIVAETSPGPTVGDTDQDLLEHARAAGSSGMHPTSTCRMGRDEKSVLDPQLRVRACRRLRVVDASAMPDLPGCNTNAPTMALAEKAADLIRLGPL